jgi:DNA invertase Pin-like site-specific DNA recombinase
MVLEDLNKLKEMGLYSRLLKNGVIPIKVNYYLEIYNYYSIRLIINDGLNDTKVQSKIDTSIAFKCSEMTVHRAIKYIIGDNNIL